MARLSESAASLRFFGDDLDPEKLTRLLGSEPSIGRRKGESYWSRGAQAEKVERTGSWRLWTEKRSPGDLDGQIAELLSPLSQDLAVWRDLSARFQADIFCGLFLDKSNEGIELQPETLVLVGSRGLILDFDIYGNPEPDNDEE
ncbi:DUF4279 domain-containing protein [Mycobacterium sp. KBS0706]|uniref:DUF4279 domain-containing protein n=1 Tax=Mycobacterium sp. KBS0706 TaxID=2578109 RepID=UPI00110F9453|nr:DUF4279 domain-containing protein [Mycobacterium sp. KBS0706]TSD90716.1 DUF4279 domain-containing protein [Mycobacterium sp. KBS0706]